MKLVASTMTDESYAIKTADLNNLLQSIIKTYGITEESLTVEFRLSSTVSTTAEPFLSNVVSTTITPYSADIQYPEIYAIGDYSSWGWDTAQSLFSFSEDEVNYEGLIDLATKPLMASNSQATRAGTTETGALTEVLQLLHPKLPAYNLSMTAAVAISPATASVSIVSPSIKKILY